MTIEPGALINVTIRDLRMGERSNIRVTAETSDGELWVLPPTAEIERVAPPEWPPQPGDIWTRGDGGRRYFAYQGNGVMRLMLDSGASWEAGHLFSVSQDLRLVDRPVKVDRP